MPPSPPAATAWPAPATQIQKELIAKITALRPPPSPRPAVAERPHRPIQRRIDIAAIGTSTGGPNALAELIPALPADLPVPVVDVQHMPALFTNLLAMHLDGKARLRVREGAAGTALEPNYVWIAPGDHHMFLYRDKNLARLGINQDRPENSCRPPVDVLFRSVAGTSDRAPSPSS